MTQPNKSVRVRRMIYYANLLASTSGTVSAVNYDDPMDVLGDTDVLDPVLAYNPAWKVGGYTWSYAKNKHV